MNRLTTDLARDDQRPYFLWNEDLTVGEVRERLSQRDGEAERERLRLLSILLREARDPDVWEFVTPNEVARELPQIAHRLGRRRRFWEFLIEGWREDGLLDR